MLLSIVYFIIPMIYLLDTTITVIKPLKNQKAVVATGGEITLEVRYKGTPSVKWYLNGKEIPTNSKSKHFEFVNVGITHRIVGPILKIKNFKKAIAGVYKIKLSNAGCVYSKSITVEVAGKYVLAT